MRVYEPKRGGDIAPCDRGNPLGAIVYQGGTPVEEFDYAVQAVAFVAQAKTQGVYGLRIKNPATRV